MIKSFKKFINYVEENYHSSFTEDDIKNITGYSYQYFKTCDCGIGCNGSRSFVYQ